MGLMLGTWPHFLATFSTPTSASSGHTWMHYKKTTTTPPSLEEPTLMTLGMLVEKKTCTWTHLVAIEVPWCD
jgi:hypothetical protein